MADLKIATRLVYLHPDADEPDRITSFHTEPVNGYYPDIILHEGTAYTRRSNEEFEPHYYASTLLSRDRQLPHVEGNRSAFPPWMLDLTIQQQSVLVLALRGPDGVRKFHPCKNIIRAYRATVLVAARYGRQLSSVGEGDTFMNLTRFADPVFWAQDTKDYLESVDEIPHHYHMHLYHGAQILAYKHPLAVMRERWHKFFMECTHDMHIPVPESEAEMDQRLSDWHRKEWD